MKVIIFITILMKLYLTVVRGSPHPPACCSFHAQQNSALEELEVRRVGGSGRRPLLESSRGTRGGGLPMNPSRPIFAFASARDGGCSTSANSTSDNSTSASWPKSKLAEVEIDRNRNWPKSKLAELEKNSWPKSKLAEVDRAQETPPVGGPSWPT